MPRSPLSAVLLTALFVPGVLAVQLPAQSVVVPNANASTPGTAQLNSIIRDANNPRTYQYGINAAELADVPIGAVITGVSLRFSRLSSNPASWPPADISWTTYDIWAGPANPTASWAADPLANFAAPPQPVRTGPMTLDANTYSNLNVAGVPNPWGEFYFDFQLPYLYLGGDLALLFSHPGSNDTNPARFPETVPSSAATHGVARVQSIHPPGVATTGATFYVMRIHYGYGAGCPSSTGAVPVLVQDGNLTGGTGGTVLLQAANLTPGVPVAMAFGAAPISAPIGGGCELLVTPDVVLFAGFANNNGRLVLPLPVAPGVSGNLFAQAAALDPLTPLGACFSNAVSPSAN